MKEFQMTESQLRVLLALRALHVAGIDFVPANKLINGYCGVNSVSAIYECLRWLEQKRYIERRQIDPACIVGDRFSITGRGLLIASRFNDLTAVEKTHI